ncbi:uncharacterized protein LOC111029554 [Myzus persicae]|uniref:uncharacterized protein LOC111029554 n=1 Tax=Myzus persicae TaxID=13164 RepID=UPI000B931F20|nr:uncharacterized protein LOC111029554 [Myzus persicae]
MFLRTRSPDTGENAGPRQNSISVATFRAALRGEPLDKWGRRLAVTETGEWTRLLVRDVLAWCKRGHGRREATLECHHCGAAVDDARYTLFACTSWAEERIEATRVLGTFDRLSIVEKMLTSKECWDTVCKFAFTVMLKKEYAERSRRGEGART